MATRTSSTVPDNNTDVNFRAWINEIHNSLIAFGWLQTSDTGQINFSTVTRPTAASIYQGFAVYKMNDSLQSTCAVFMRIDFGTCGSADAPGIKIQVCIGSTNGAGTLTGNLSSVMVTGSASLPANTSSFNCRTSGDTSSFRMHMWSSSVADLGWTFAIERDRDTSGAATSLGVSFALTYLSGGTGSIAVSSQFLELAGGTGSIDVTRWYAMVSSASSQSGGGNVGVAPVRTVLGPFRNPMIGVLVYARTDFTAETTTPVTIYGVSHTYLMLRPSLTAKTLNQWNADCGVAILWE